MENITYGPNETQGREFKGEGYQWVLIFNEGKVTYAKVSPEAYSAALMGAPFEIWHPLVPTPQGLSYMSASSATLEPWAVRNYSVLAVVHPAEAAKLDDQVQKLLSKIQLYTENSMPKAPGGPRGIIKG
jgi:hypothetical protein